MKLKVCGMRERQNIVELGSVSPDFIGFIFYQKSPRYVGRADFETLPATTKRVGVFVNPTENEVKEKVGEFELDIIQLHGDEPVEFVMKLQKTGLSVIKVFSVMDELPLEKMKNYEPYVDFFLLDTKTPAYGGSGEKFDWRMLERYNLSKPFFLSGGIDLDDIEEVKNLKSDKLYAIDVNSRFETAPGVKNIEKIKELKRRMI